MIFSNRVKSTRGAQFIDAELLMNGAANVRHEHCKVPTPGDTALDSSPRFLFVSRYNVGDFVVALSSVLLTT